MLNRNFQFRNNVDALQQAYVTDLIQRERARQAEYIKAREYYDGIQESQLTERLRQFLRPSANADFTVNYCPMVVDAKANRLSVSAFETEDASGETYWQWWRKNRMDKTQGVVHRAAIRDGDAFVLVEWDDESSLPRFHFEPAYAGDGVMVYYSDERRTEMEFASKSWQIRQGKDTGKLRRMNLYFPNRIEKYISHDDKMAGRWMPYEDDDTNEVAAGRLGMAGIIWWTDTRTQEGEPLGIPIVHFKHNDSGDSYGTSHLAKVIPIQDAVNKAMIDLLGAMDSNGFPLLVGYGSNEWANIKVAPGAIAAISTKKTDGVELGKIDPMSPEGLLAVYNALVMEIGRISGTPLSYFQVTGHVASEGTMKQQEIALITQIQKTQVDFGNAWEDVMIVARRLYNTFGDGGLDEDSIIDTIWDEAESRNEKAQAETLAIKVEKLGVTEAQAQSELGYNATEIADFAREKLRQQARAINAMIKVDAANQAPTNEPDQNLTQTDTGETDDQARAPTT